MARARHTVLGIVAASLAASLWVVACGDGTTDPPPAEPPRATTIAVSPATIELAALGATRQLSAQVLDQNGNAMAGAAVTWSSGDSSVATVDASGLVTAAGNGTATITATSGSAQESVAVTVAQEVEEVVVTPEADTLVALGDTLRFAAEARDANGHAVSGAEFTWASGDTAVATVDGSGVVRAADNGTATITASAGSASGSAAVTVAQQADAVVVSPAAARISLGETVRLTAAATDANGYPVADAVFAWSSSNTRFATVDATGLVTATGRGVAVVSAAVDEVEGSAALAVAVEAPVWVAFTADSLRLSEGETRLVGVQYGAFGLAAPQAIRVSALEDRAESADYELSETRFVIPAGDGAAGTFDLTIAARADDAFAEGEEGIALELSVPGATEAEVGGALPVVIADAGVSPVPGISLTATPPERVRAVPGLTYIQAQDRLRTTLTSEWRPDSEGVSMRWIGPYGERREWLPHHPYYDFAERAKPPPPQPDFHIEAWRVASGNSVATHEMDVSWSAESRLELLFGGDVGVACAANGCSMADDARSAASQRARASIPGPGVARPSHGFVVPYQRDTPWTIGADAGAPDVASRYLLSEKGRQWHPSVWPPGDTLVFHLSNVNWPENAGMTPEEAKDLLNEMLAEWSDIPTADILWRVEGPVDLQPGRDGKNIFFLQPEYEHGRVGSLRWYDETDGIRGLVEMDHSLGQPWAVSGTRADYDRSPWHYIANEMGMHPIGHTLGLEHAAAFPVARSCPAPTYDVHDCGRVNGDSGYWRRVSGAWPLDPVMSYGVSSILSWTADGRTLRLDDKIGASLLRPKPGWLATTGTIAGSVRTGEGGPAPHIHIWALRPTDGGRMDGVGAFADRNGNFRIQGLPPGDWILIAHPDLDWLANPWFFYERQGELLDEMFLYPVRAIAGQTTGGIEITMSRGRVTTVR